MKPDAQTKASEVKKERKKKYTEDMVRTHPSRFTSWEMQR
jgi:hypothetical protein